jgi:type I restriction enzyme M protein
VPEDELGNGYEFLIKKFADDSGHTAQEFYTNRTVVHLMVQMLDPQPGESIYDPTCGTGGMLISALAEVKRKRRRAPHAALYGQERNHMTAAIARMNLVLHGVEDFAIARGDTLAAPPSPRATAAHLRRGAGQSAVLDQAVEPRGVGERPVGRNFLGTPPQGRADYAFFQHILQSMDPQDRALRDPLPARRALPQGGGRDAAEAVEADLVECVLGLGPNLFYNSPMEACVVFCRRGSRPRSAGRCCSSTR